MSCLGVEVSIGRLPRCSQTYEQFRTASWPEAGDCASTTGLYDRLRASGRVKTDLSSAMYAAWTKATSDGKDPTAKQIAVATGASVSTAQAALRRFRAGTVPKAKPPGLEAKTVRNIHVMLHSALANAVRWRYVIENVTEHVNPPKVKRRKPTVWTSAQMRKFLQFAAGDRFYALFLLAATTGLRRAELCGLRWPAIDLERQDLDGPARHHGRRERPGRRERR